MKRPNAVEAVAKAFAAALDSEDYAAVNRLLAHDCLYRAPKGPIMGARAILDSYQAASAWARSHVEQVDYESTVRVDSATSAVITFIDRLHHAGRAHRYSCEQEIFVGPDGRISQIIHRDLPGERESVESFFRSLHIERQA